MDSLKELLKPKTMNRLSYVAIFCWVVIGVILLGIFADMENSESRFDFRCGTERGKIQNEDLVRAKCFEQYRNLYNKSSFPVYGFVILNFSLILFFGVIYSQLATSRVDRLLDHERQRPPKSYFLFVAYCCQLAARFVFGILFIVLQTQLLYPSNFPTSFDCTEPPGTAGSSRTANASTGNIQNSTIYECINQRAKNKTFWTIAVSVVNGVFTLIILIEIIWIFSRARKEKQFPEDSQFLKDHLNSNYEAPQQEQDQEVRQQEENEEFSLPVVSQESELPQPRSFIENLKKNIIENTETPTDLKPLFQPKHGEGERIEDLKLDSIYTNLVLIPNRAQYDFSGEREEQLKEYPMPKENFQPLKGPEDIIDAENKKIVIIGRPGIGKTLFCTKFIRDWASGRVFNTTQDAELDFGIAFLIKFRKFNSVETLSLRGLLASAEYSETECLANVVWNYILENPEKVLILFDGMDELVDHTRIANETVNNSYKDIVEEKMPMAALYSKIVSGKFLPGAAVVTTTRPTAVSCLRGVQFNRTIEILGFAAEEVEEYVKNFPQDAAENLSGARETAAKNLSDAGESAAENSSGAGEKIWRHISTNMNLFSLCYIPVNCFIICSCLLEVLQFYTKKGNDLIGVGLPTKLTEIYKQAVKLFYFRHNEQYRGECLSREEIESDKFPPEFKLLGEVAFNGVKEGRLVFGKSEVHGLENSSLFHQMPDHQIGPFKHESQFCFMHLTMQEFLAAKYITDPDTMNEEELRRFVSDNIKKGEWQVVLQFVAGLLGERDDKSIEIFTSLLPVKTKMFSDEITRWPTDSDKHLALTIIKCLYEGSKLNVIHPIVQNKLDSINCNSVDFSDCGLAPADCTALVHIIKNMKQISHINLSFNHIGSLGCVEIKKLFESDKSKLTSLGLMANRIGDEGLVHLSKGIKTSRLTWLDLRGNKDITPEAKQRFRDDNPNCEVDF